MAVSRVSVGPPRPGVFSDFPGKAEGAPRTARRSTRRPNSPESANPTQAPEYTGTLHNPLCSPSKGYPNPLVCNVHIIMLPIPSLSNVRGPPHPVLTLHPVFCVSLAGPHSQPFPLQGPLVWGMHPGLLREEKVPSPCKTPKLAQEVKDTSLDLETHREANESKLNKI